MNIKLLHTRSVRGTRLSASSCMCGCAAVRLYLGALLAVPSAIYACLLGKVRLLPLLLCPLEPHPCYARCFLSFNPVSLPWNKGVDTPYVEVVFAQRAGALLCALGQR